MKDKHVLVIDSYENGNELIRDVLLQLGKKHNEITFATSYNDGRKVMEGLSDRGERCLVIADCLVKDFKAGSHIGRRCTSELLRHAIDLGYDVTIYTSGKLSKDLQSLVGQGVHCITKSSEHFDSPEEFYKRVLAPALK